MPMQYVGVRSQWTFFAKVGSAYWVVLRIFHTFSFRLVALVALKSDRTMSELVQHFDIYPNQIWQWKDHLQTGVKGVFDDRAKASKAPDLDQIAACQGLGSGLTRVLAR